MSRNNYDIAVIGGGPGGYVAAIAAAKEGKSVCLFEENRVGGVCLNEGCIPTKALLKGTSVLETVKEAEAFGVEFSSGCKAECKINMEALQKRKAAVINQLVGGVEFLLKGNGVTVIKGSAKFKDSHTIVCDEEVITADNVIIATGSEVMRLPIECEPGSSILTSREVLALDHIPSGTVIIGGGVVGVELAFFLARAGSKVTVLELMDRILPMVDKEVVSQAAAMLKKKGIDIVTEAKVKKIGKAAVSYELGGNENTVCADAIVMAAGRSPRTSGINVEALSLEMDRKAIKTDNFMRTSVDGVYAIGDVNGKSMLAHTASKEAEIAVSCICGQEKEMDYSAIPSCIYLEPELACVGMTEEQAISAGKNVLVGRFPMYANGKALIEGQSAGMIKVIVDGDTDKILGAHMFCVHATDMISGVGIAMTSGLTAKDVLENVFPHPTVSEAVHEALLASYGKAIHIK